MTRAMLLCAGQGTRLGPMSSERPKPMLPVCNIPILRYGIALLAHHGVRDLVINLHHRGDVIRSALGDGSHLGVHIDYVAEENLLGTGGGLKNALHLLDPEDTDEPFLSLNGKLIFDVDLHALLAAFAAAEAADILGMMVVRPVPDALDWGAVDVDVSAPIPAVRDILGNGHYMFCGVHVTRPSVVRRLPAGETCMIRQGYLPWLQSGETVAAFIADSRRYFAEHSTPDRYLQSNLDILHGTRPRCLPGPVDGIDPLAAVDPTAVVHGPVRIGAGASIGAHAVVGPGAVIGDNASIAPHSHIEHTVVWPNAQAHGRLRRCIVTGNSVVDASVV